MGEVLVDGEYLFKEGKGNIECCIRLKTKTPVILLPYETKIVETPVMLKNLEGKFCLHLKFSGNENVVHFGLKHIGYIPSMDRQLYVKIKNFSGNSFIVYSYLEILST